MLQNRFGECTLSFLKEKEYQIWSNTLAEQILKFQTSKSAAKNKECVDYEKIIMCLDLKILHSSVKFCNEDGIALGELSLGELVATCKARSYDFTAKASLKNLIVKDLQRHNSSIQFNTLVRNIDEDSRLIDLNIEYANSDSPLYIDQDLIINIKLGKAELN